MITIRQGSEKFICRLTDESYLHFFKEIVQKN